MQSFSFKSDYDENRNIERIITERNRRLAKQQVIFTILLLILLVLLGWYIFRKVVYTEFDGYIQTEYKDYRAVEDVYLFDQYTSVGDIVIPGDTLYSFVYINLFGTGSMSSEPGVVLNDRNARVQVNLAYAEANVLRVRIRELENQIEKEDNNIRFGLTDNSHKMDLQRQLAEAREQLNATLKKAGMYGNIRNESQSAVNKFGQYSIDFANDQGGIDYMVRQIYERKSSAIRYEIAQDTALVTKLWATPFSRVFKEEHILQLESVSLEDSNMQVVAYVPAHYMDRVNNNTRAEVIVNNKVKFWATVELLGARTEELPDELRNSLSHTYTSIMVVLSPDKDQVLPLWAAVDKVPVKVRIKNYDNGRRDDGSDYWYITRDGLTEESKYYLGMLRKKSAENPYHYNPVDEEHPAPPQSDLTGSIPVKHDVKEEESKPQQPKQEPAKPQQQSQQAEKQQAAATDAKAVKEEPRKAAEPKTETNAEAKTETKPEAKPAEKPAAKGEADGKGEYIRHRVEWGETLYGIAQYYGVKVDDIIALNPGTEDILYAETVILIPVRTR